MLTHAFRHALRIFRREPAFAAAATLTLAIGIGANTAIFSVVEAALLRPLPYPEADRLVRLRHLDVRTGLTKDNVALGDVMDLRGRQTSLEVLAAFNGFQSMLVDGSESLRVQGLAATPELFAALRVRPAAGRFVEAGDVTDGAPAAVIVSHALWETRFGHDAHLIGRSVQIGTTRRTVVGILPPGFHYPSGATTDVIVPMQLPAAAPANRRAWIHAMGRLRPGASVDDANVEFATLSKQLEDEFPDSNRGTRYYMLSARDSALGATKGPLLLLLAAVGFVLLVACANVGNLMLARTLGRSHEMAVRMALGAGRARIAAPIFAEAIVLGLAGGALGVLVAWPAAPALAALVPQATPIPGLEAVTVNTRVLAFACGASLLSAILFGAIAAAGVGRPSDAIGASRRTTMNPAARTAAASLVVVEVALAVVLLLGAGLTLRSFANLVRVDPGFSTAGVLVVDIALPPGRYADAPARRGLYDRLVAAIEALPGVQAAGAGVVMPLTGNNWTVPFERADQPVPPGDRPPDVGWQSASGGYFRALRIPLRGGRLFDASDRPGGAPVVIISESIVRRFFPDGAAVGRRIRLGQGEAEIVGVVGDIRRGALTEEPRADMYFPFEREPGSTVKLFIRTDGDPLAALPAVRATVRGLEPHAALYSDTTLDRVAAQSTAVLRVAMQLLGGFAVLAVVLASIGLYGVMSYTVRRRDRELGTRMALGATRRHILTLVLREAGSVTGLGLVVGLGAGLALSQGLGALLYGVPPWDPGAVAAAAAALATAALAASYLPAWRASRIDPARTLAE